MLDGLLGRLIKFCDQSCPLVQVPVQVTRFPEIQSKQGVRFAQFQTRHGLTLRGDLRGGSDLTAGNPEGRIFTRKRGEMRGRYRPAPRPLVRGVSETVHT